MGSRAVWRVRSAQPVLTRPLLPRADRTDRSAYDGIRNLLRSKYPSCGIVVFGSAANALGIRDNNDIDVSLSLDGLEDTREAKGESCRPFVCPSGRGWCASRAC